MAYESITLHVDKDHGTPVPPEGPGGSISADSIPGAARKEYEEGEGNQREEDADAGVKHYRKAIQVMVRIPKHIWHWAALHGARKFDDAQSALQAANDITPTAPGGYLALGTMYNAQKKYDDAEKALTHGLALKPDVPDGQYELAKTFWAPRKWQDAEPHAQKAVALAPNMAPPHVLLATSLCASRTRWRHKRVPGVSAAGS